MGYIVTRNIIGITGRKRTGKDTAALYLSRRFKYDIYRFADPIKHMILNLLNHIDSDDLDLETDKELEISGINASYRKLAQTLGTEWGRNLIDPNLWVYVLDFNSQFSDNIVIPDVRFDNEAEWVIDNGGILIEIVKDTSLKDDHQSEAGISSKYKKIVIINNGSIKELESQLDAILPPPDIKSAFIDLLDGSDISDIVSFTGLSIERATEIYYIYDQISRN